MPVEMASTTIACNAVQLDCSQALKRELRSCSERWRVRAFLTDGFSASWMGERVMSPLRTAYFSTAASAAIERTTVAGEYTEPRADFVRERLSFAYVISFGVMCVR